MSSHPRFTRNVPGSAFKKTRTVRRRSFRPHAELMEDRTLLATMIWTNAAGGDWDTASNWVNAADPSDQHVPTACDDAAIDLPDITITHDSPDADAVNCLKITAADTTLDIANGSLALAVNSSIAGNLTIQNADLSTAGTLTVGGATTWIGGTISGGGTLVIPSGASLAMDPSNVGYLATLDGVVRRMQEQ